MAGFPCLINMKKTGWIILFNLIMLSIWLVSIKGKYIQKDYDVNITIEASVSENTVNEVKDTLQVIPGKVLESFVEDDWKIVLLNTFDEEEDYEYIASDGTVVGLINYTQKTIIVKGIPVYNGTTKNIVLHEMCHYIDRLWGNISETDKFMKLYEAYKNGRYRTYAYAGITITEPSKSDILYATSSNYEFFAETLKDYYLHPDYLKENYNDIYEFHKVLHITNK